MNTLTETRRTLAAVLDAAGIASYDHAPERLEVPCALVTPAEDWVSGGDTFGSFTCSYNVTVVADKGDNDTMSDDLDALVAEVLIAFSGLEAGWGASGVAGPAALQYNNATYLAATVTVTRVTHIETI